MASARTRDRGRNTVKTRSKANPTYKELGVSELAWPAEDDRELSQEIVRVNPSTRHSILQARSHKFVVSHWGKTSSLVASLTVNGLASYSGWRTRAIKEGCDDCAHNRQENIVARKSDKPTCTTNYWTSLSDEIILSIFQFLPKKTVVKCASVCKHWQRLAYDESLWRCVDMTKANLPPGLLGKVLKRGTRVLRLAQAKIASPVCDDNASSFSDVVPLSPQSPSESTFSLRYLDATCCSFENDTLLCLLLHSTKLTHISLESCSVSTSVLKAISELRNLKVLNLAMCTGVTVTGICSLVKGGKNTRLKELNLAWTNLTKATVLNAIKNLPKLQKLNLSGYREILNDDSIKQLVKSCPHLTHLDLSDAFNLTAKSLEEILKLEKLVHLSLSRCYSIAPAAFSSCLQRRRLKKLDIFGFLNPEGIDILKKELPDVDINKTLYSTIARPVGSMYLGKIWDVQCKD